MFSKSQKEHSLVVSMDDKAYLRPGTDVGARNTKAGVIHEVCDPNEKKKLQQHDFNNPEVNQTPASFRLMKQHIENIQDKHELISDQDQSLVNHSYKILQITVTTTRSGRRATRYLL